MSGARVAVLAGAGRGIGAATARRMRAAGLQVEILDAFGIDDPRYPLASEDDRTMLEDDGFSCRTVDLRDRAATVAQVDAAAERHGGIDAVVTFAGAVSGGVPLWETRDDVLDDLLALNTRTAWNLAAAGVPHLLQQPADRRPTFVAVTSMAGRRGLFGLSPYVVAKHATVGVVRALAADLAGTSVTACGVSPGATDTTMLRRTADAYRMDDIEVLAGMQHTRKPFDADELAAVVEFAASAGPVLHGAVLAADGGTGYV